MTALIISLVVGLGLPSLVALVTKAALPALAKQLILLGFAAATGVLTGLVGAPPSGWNQWEHVLAAIGIAFVAAVQSKYGLSEVHSLIQDRTKLLGIGPSPTPDA